MKTVRRKLGGDIWESDIEEIHNAIFAANNAVEEILTIMDRHKNAHFLLPVVVYLTTISSNLTKISTLVQEIDQIVYSHKMRERRDRNDNNNE